MKGFTFPLDRVLKFKERRRQLAEIRHEQAAAALRAAQAEARALREQIDQLCSHLQGKLGKAQVTTTWIAVYLQSARLEQTLQTVGQKVERAAQELELAAAAHKQAAQEVEALRSLRHQKWQQFRKDALQASQERLDDLSLQRWLAARALKTADADTKGTQA